MENMFPDHLAIIVDGNRRWAKEKGLSSFEGHKAGFDNVERIADACLERGIKILTIYCFSSENWDRSRTEVNYLMKLLGLGLDKYTKKCIKDNIRLLIIGQKERLSKSLQAKIKKSEEITKDNKKAILNLAISYGGRAEIVQAMSRIRGEITEKSISDNLWTAGQPDPDFIIRTGGEGRLSGFLTWQSIYSELYFTDKYWPDFASKDLDLALEDYSKRKRRFGK
jgi:undecaprenyl diphosphate synthase